MPKIAYLADPRIAELVGPIDGLTIVTDADGEPPPDAYDAEVYVPKFLSGGASTEIVARLPQLRLLQLATAGAEAWLPVVPDGVTLATARGAHGAATAEWAVAGLLAVLREFPGFLDAQREQRWTSHNTDLLAGKTAIVIGAGDLGERTRRRLAAFDVDVTMVARTARDGIRSIDELPGLLPEHDVVVLVLPLTEESTGLVDAAFLAAMPDGAVLVNAARGRVVDTDALVAELQSGRLRAALDVTEPEPLPAGHPLWTVPGLFLTPHVGGSAFGADRRAAAVVRDQLTRYAAGAQVHNVVGASGY